MERPGRLLPTMNEKPCLLCRSTRLKRLGDKLDQTYFICQTCGLVIGSALWEPRGALEAGGMYDAGYLAKSGAMHPRTTARYHEILDYIETRIGAGRRMVEVGFGNGQFLLAARERGWDVLGVEINRAACDHIGQSLGIATMCGSFEEVTVAPGSMDLVASMETIEHLYDPASFVQRAREVLKSGGIIFLTTPNAGCLTRDLIGMDWRGYYRGHTVLFTARRLERFLVDQGFEVIRMETRTILPGTVINTWKSRLRGRGRFDAEGKPNLPGNIQLSDAQDLRDRVEANPALRWSKAVLNGILNATRKGEKTLIWARKP